MKNMINNTKFRFYILLICLLLLSFIMNVVSFQTGHEWGGDFCHYLAQSKALVKSNIHEFERFYSFTFNNSLSKPGPVFAPWGFSVLLMPVYFIFGDSIAVFKTYTYLFQFFALIFLFLLAKRVLNQKLAVLLVAMLAYHPLFFEFKEIVQADTPHLFFVMLNLWLIDCFLFDKQKVRSAGFFVLLGISLYFAFMIKTIGSLLMATLFLSHVILLIKEHNIGLKYFLKRYLEFIPYFVFIVLYLFEKWLLPGSHATYSFSYTHSLVETIFTNTKVYLRTLYEFLSLFNNAGLLLTILNFGFLFGSFMLVLYVLWKNMTRTFHFLIYLILSFCVLLPLPFNGGGFRYLLPALLIYLILCFIGIQNLYMLFQSKKAITIRWIKVKYLIFLIMLPWLFQTSGKFYHAVTSKTIIDGPYKPESKEMFSFITKHVSSEEKIIFFKPRVMNYFTNKYAYRIIDPRKELDSTFFCNLAFLDWNYLVLSKEKASGNEKKLTAFEQVFANQDFLIYRNIP